VTQVATFIALAIGFALILKSVRSEHNHIIEHFDRVTKRLEKVVIMSAQDSINAVVAQLGKAKAEIVAKIADVQAQLDAASVPAEQVDLSALTAAAQALDDVVADAPVEVPVEVPVEEAPVEVPVEEVPAEEV
jgi:hypothetical protein